MFKAKNTTGGVVSTVAVAHAVTHNLIVANHVDRATRKRIEKGLAEFVASSDVSVEKIQTRLIERCAQGGGGFTTSGLFVPGVN